MYAHPTSPRTAAERTARLHVAYLAWIQEGRSRDYATVESLLKARLLRAFEKIGDGCAEEWRQDFMDKKVARRAKACLLPKAGVSFHRHLSCVIRNARISYFRSATRRARKGALVDDIARIATWEEDAAERLDARRKLAATLKVLGGVSPRQRIAFIFAQGLYAAGLDLEPHLRDLAVEANESFEKVAFRAERAMRSRSKADAVRVLYPDYDPTSQDAANTEWAFNRTAHRGETTLFQRCKGLLAG